MSDSEHRLVRLPPLAIPPEWATAPPPQPEALDALRAVLTAELPHLLSLQAILGAQPNPGMMRLHGIPQRMVLRDAVLIPLRAMRYPAEWTRWVDTARTLACRASDDLNRCYEAINQLKWLAEDASDYRRYLAAAREMSIHAYRHTLTLHSHFACPPEHKSAPQRPTASRKPARVIHLAEAIRRRPRS